MNEQDNEKESKPTESSLKKKDITFIPYDNYYINKKYFKSCNPHAGKGTVKSLSQKLLTGM